MPTFNYRPFGPLRWLLPRVSTAPWAYYGCEGTEERSLTAWLELVAMNLTAATQLVRIQDLPSRHDTLTATRLQARRTEFTAAGGSVTDIVERRLLAPHSEIVDLIRDFATRAGPNLILDITSLPKRFFFPALRILMRGGCGVQNLIVTYTAARTYPKERLAENHNDWAHLPLFNGSYSGDPASLLVAGVGFEAFGLREQIDHGGSGMKVKLLLPFPAAPSAVRRSWVLAQRLMKSRPSELFEIHRADARDPSDTFDRLSSLTDRGNNRAILAPFGPKPMSLGMCLFAVLADTEVFYTQPTVYHPDYSIGVAQDDGLPRVHAFLICMNGVCCYEL